MSLAIIHQKMSLNHYAVIYGGNEIGRVAKIGGKWIAFVGRQEIGQGDTLAEADMILFRKDQSERMVVAS